MLVDRRHCTNVCDVRSVRGADIESDHLGTILANKNELKPEIEKIITNASRTILRVS
jgi:hypothetical protein